MDSRIWTPPDLQERGEIGQMGATATVYPTCVWNNAAVPGHDGHPRGGDSTASRPQGPPESSVSPPPVRPFCHHSSLSSNRELKSRRVSAQPHAAAVIPCRLSYVPPRVSSAQAMRAILLASATAATFLCRRAATFITQRLRGSSLRAAPLSTARAP